MFLLLPLPPSTPPPFPLFPLLPAPSLFASLCQVATFSHVEDDASFWNRLITPQMREKAEEKVGGARRCRRAEQ